jgi:hypothetical protein
MCMGCKDCQFDRLCEVPRSLVIISLYFDRSFLLCVANDTFKKGRSAIDDRRSWWTIKWIWLAIYRPDVYPPRDVWLSVVASCDCASDHFSRILKCDIQNLSYLFIDQSYWTIQAFMVNHSRKNIMQLKNNTSWIIMSLTCVRNPSITNPARHWSSTKSVHPYSEHPHSEHLLHQN